MENRYIHFGLVLGIIAAISAGILGGVNSFTTKVIADNAIKVVNEARREVLPIAINFSQDDKKVVEGIEYIPGLNENKEIVGYVASVTSPGYGGDIKFVLGIDKEAKITGLNVISNAETPGLGAKITTPEWLEHWKGKDSSYEFNKTVDAFAGATISPQAVYTGIIKALKAFEAEVNK